MKLNFHEIGINVIDLQIKALRKLKNSLNGSFNEALRILYNCKSKVIICGVGKSGIIASKISATLSSVGTPSFSISASDCSHGDLGRITTKDVLILISYSGNTDELKNIIKYSKINKIPLIGIVSNKNSELYKNSNVKLLIPEVLEAGYGIVPTSSTTTQLAIGDALAIALMQKKKFGKFDFKKFHPSGSLSKKLKTAADLMLTGKKIPFVKESELMKKALKILNIKRLGFVIAFNKKGHTSGIFTDGDLKRLIQKKKEFKSLKLKTFMTKSPYMVEKNTLASEVLKQMNRRKITGVCVFEKENIKKTIGVIHIHNLIRNFKMDG